MSKKPTVIIYRDHLLPASETFVRAQAEALQDFTPYYVGSRLVPGLLLPSERTLVVNRGGLLGRASEVSHKLFGFAPTLMGRLRELKPRLIHAHFGTDGVRALPLAQHLKVPLLVTFHGFEVTGKDEYTQGSFYGHRVYVRRRHLLNSKGHLFIAVSNFIKRKALEQGFTPDKVVVHYIGVDTELFHPDPVVQRESVVLFVGRLVEKKGCEYLIKAMSKVQAAIPEAELVVIGDGLLRSNLEQLAEKTLRRYQFLGAQPPESVRAWMNKARVFCVPSVIANSGDSEGFGMVFAEAQAMGLPVVSFATGGIPEAVAHGETGFLANEYDWEKLSNYIIRLLKDQTLWHQFSQNGQRRVSALFNLQKQTGILEDIYKQVIIEKELL
jgi:colanic acid/amylovoran biosynthesis glycosyltransferase